MGEHGELASHGESESDDVVEHGGLGLLEHHAPGLLMAAVNILAGRPRGLVESIVPAVLEAVHVAAPEPAEPAVDRVVVDDLDDLDWFFDELCAKAVGYTVAVDEAHLFWHHPALTKLIFTCEHREQDWWLITQRVAHAPHAILSQINTVVSFSMWWPPDLDVMLERFGLDPEELKTLGVGEYVERNVNLIAGDEQ